MFYTPISEQLKILDRYIDAAKTSLADKPTGGVVLHKSHGRYQYLYKENPSVRRPRYMRKDETPLICALIQKDYDQKFLAAAGKLQAELNTLAELHGARSASCMYRPLGAVYDKLLPARKKYIEPYVLPDALFIEKWLGTPYDTRFYSTEQPMLQTEKGDRVRSKSEKIIADKYTLLGIPYLYEKSLRLRDIGTVHADFTLLDINERKTVIHEHFGLMADQEYSQQAMNKYECYIKSGYQPGIDLLTTFEGGTHIFDTLAFDQLIRSRFLSFG